MATENAKKALVQQTTDIANGSTGSIAGVLGNPVQADDIAGAYQSAQLEALNTTPSCADLSSNPDTTSCMDPVTHEIEPVPLADSDTGTGTSTGTSISDGIIPELIFAGSGVVLYGLVIMSYMGKAFVEKIRGYNTKIEFVPLKNSLSSHVNTPNKFAISTGKPARAKNARLEIRKAGAGIVIGLAMLAGGIVLAVCGGADLCLADTNTLPTKITTSNERLQAMLQASDDFRFSMHSLAKTLYPTAAATTP